VARAGTAEPLPTWPEFSARVNAAKKLTVRDVWGLMLTSLPGACARARARRCAPALERASQRRGVRSGWGCPVHGRGCCWTRSAAQSTGNTAGNPAVCGLCFGKQMLSGALPPTRWSSAHTSLQRTWLPAPLLRTTSAVRSICMSCVLRPARWAWPPRRSVRAKADRSRAGAGVGPELAEAVLRAFATPRALWRAYAAALAAAAAAGQPAAPAAAAVLAGLPVSAHRKVSPAQAAKVFGGLFACGWEAAAPG
jgi:hypothetical protein